MIATLVLHTTGYRIPVAEMNHEGWFSPKALPGKESRGVCRRLGTDPDGRVNCEWSEYPHAPKVERFTLPGGELREVLRVEPVELDEAA